MAPRKPLTIQEKANLIEEASKPGMTQAKLLLESRAMQEHTKSNTKQPRITDFF